MRNTSETPAPELEQAVKDFPVKCDNCPWTGKVGEARMAEGKATCPQCGGSLAGNRIQDQLCDMLADLPNPDGWD